MAEEQKNQNQATTNYGAHLASNVAKAANTARNAVEAAGRAGVGDIAGAAMTLLKDENIRKALVAIIVGVALLLTCCSMFVTSAVTGTVEYVYRTLGENWEEAWEEQGIASQGNALYLYTIGAITAGVDAIATTISGSFREEDEADNSEIEDTSSAIQQAGHVYGEDYNTSMKAMYDEESLTGEDGALLKRINMIKARVEQRGNQLASNLTEAQYELDAMGIAIAEVLQSMFTDPLLYNGVDTANSGVTVNTSAFQFSDLQALKILAAYSIQNDCLLTDIDMWDLMEYCGWYAVDMEELDVSTLGESSIYNTSADGTFEEEIGGAVQAGDSISGIYQLEAPMVPKWTGTFAPQWYYEEIAYLVDNNAEYDRIEQREADQAERRAEAGITETEAEDPLADMVRYPEDSEGHIIVDNFEKLADFETYGLIDKIYTSSRSTLKISRSDYTGADAVVDEALAKLVDSIILRSAWDEAYGSQSKTTDNGNLVARDEDDNHTYTITSGTVAGRSYYLVEATSGGVISEISCTADGQQITFTGLDSNTTYYVYEKITTVTVEPDPTEETTDGGDEGESETEPTPPPNVEDATLMSYTGGNYEVTFLGLVPPQQTAQVVLLAETTTTESTQIDTFTTFPAAAGYQAYQLRLNVEVNFSAVSVDTLFNELIGLWPGSLRNVEADENGVEYAAGQVGNELLRKSWTDNYTDAEGNVTELTFERRQGYQVDAYEDLVLTVADMLGYNIAGLYSPTYGYGDDIVAMAKKEYEYYHANGLSGGMRYWDMATSAGGNSSINYDAAWCVCFVLCCAWQCGYIAEGAVWGNFDGGDWIFWCGGFISYMVDNGYGVCYDSVGSYTPVPGDLIFFNEGSVGSSSPDHIGIVVEVDESGNVHYIDGNSGGGAGSIGWSSCTAGIGSTAYGTTVVCAYLHPNYPVTINEDPLYLDVTGTVQPRVTARMVNAGNQELLLAGVGRFRESQLPAVVDELETVHPEFYTQALRDAVEAGDMTAFISEWNSIGSGRTDEWKQLQLSISAKNYVNPVVSEVKKQTGFDWTETMMREELLLGIVTTTDRQDALVDLLVDLCSGMDNNTPDQEFLDTLSARDGSNSVLYNIVNDHRADLWPMDSTEMQDAWIASIHDLLELMIEEWEDIIASVGDPSASVEEQVFYYLTHSMGLPVSSACGVLANIQHESNFNPNAVGDNGTSYGLCQWHNERYDALINYCNSNGLDYRTVQGQMEYLKYELENSYPSMLSELRSMPNTEQGAYDAGYLWCVDFERPADAESKAYSRGSLAKGTYWPRYCDYY